MNNKRWVIFGICTSLLLMSLFFRVSSAIIAPDLSRDLGLNPQGLGLLGAAFFYAFALIQLPLGLFLDRFGAQVTMVLLNLIGIVGTVIFARACGLTGGVIGRSLLGLGMAANFMGTLKLFSKWFELKKFATLSGLVVSLATLGSLLATSPLALLVQALGWRGAFYALAGLQAFLTACLITFVRDSPLTQREPYPTRAESPAPLSALSSIKMLMLGRDYWAISFSMFLRYGAFVSIQALWAGPFLMSYLGLAAVPAGNILLMLSIGFSIGSVTGGVVSDRVLRSRKKTLVFGLSISAFAVFFLSLWQGTAFLPLLGAILFAFGFSNGFGPVSYAHIREIMPEEMSGTAMAGINFFSILGGGVFIHGLGAVIERMAPDLSVSAEAYRNAFMICFWALCCALALYIITRDSVALKKARN
jgi:MFS family permease